MSYLEKIKEYLQHLQVESDAHKEENIDSSREVIASHYVKGLTLLKESLNELQELEREGKRTLIKCLLPELLVGVVCHTGLHYWTSKRSRQLAKDSLINILKLCYCQSVLELLVGGGSQSVTVSSPYAKITHDMNTIDSSPRQPIDSSPRQPVDPQPVDLSPRQPLFSHGVLKEVLSYLRERLQKGEWKRHPNAKHALLWCLKYMKHPHVSKYCDSFLPPLLLLLDDHEIYHKHLGLTGLSHLIRNMDSAELIQYGRAHVIYEAIKGLLYFNEIDIINSLHPCLLLLLPILEGPPARRIDTPKKPGKIDEVFSILLYSMDTESKIPVRKAYSHYVHCYIELLGIYSVRYLKRLLTIISHYIEYPDYCGEETRRNCLRLLSLLMKHTWPRIPGHSDYILKMIIKLVSDLCPDQTTEPQGIDDQLSLVVECLSLLMYCDTNIKVRSYDSLLVSSHHCVLIQCIEKAISSTTATV